MSGAINARSAHSHAECPHGLRHDSSRASHADDATWQAACKLAVQRGTRCFELDGLAAKDACYAGDSTADGCGAQNVCFVLHEDVVQDWQETLSDDALNPHLQHCWVLNA